MTDSIADMLARIRNAQQREKEKVTVPASKLRQNVLEVLKREGYIHGYSTQELKKGISQLVVELKYDKEGSVIREMKKVSKPGRRVYAGAQDLPFVYNGLGISVISTSKGVMSDCEARQANVGGEILCEVF